MTCFAGNNYKGEAQAPVGREGVGGEQHEAFLGS